MKTIKYQSKDRPWAYLEVTIDDDGAEIAVEGYEESYFVNVPRQDAIKLAREILEALGATAEERDIVVHDALGMKVLVDDDVPPGEVHFRQGRKLVGKIVNLAHESGRKVPKMGATDQPTRTTATNNEPGGEGPKPRRSG